MNMPEREKVIKGLECCMVGEGHSPNCEVCPYATYGDDTCDSMDALFSDALALLKAQEPREITKDEWQAWKKSKKRDPLCYMWAGDDTPIWALKPEDIHEPAYLSGQIVIFNGKPTEKQREATPWE